MSALIRTMVFTTAATVLVASMVGPARAAVPPVESGTAPTMVVLDASGSMTANDAPGRRIDAAKRAVAGLVDRLPDDARVGLEVYGTGTGSAPSERAAGCRDIKVVTPVGPVDRAAFVSRVRGIRASGYTPIGRALRTAAAALPSSGKRSIVLVSDGEDTCAPPNPCDVARSLNAQGLELSVHTVGFKVNARARAQLQCIARATGGSYRDAADGPALANVLGDQVERAVRGYTAQGRPITGGDTSGSAPVLRPGTQYVDRYAHGAETVSDDGTAKYYRVDLAAGQTPYVSATLVPPAGRAGKYTSLRVEAEIRPLDTSVGCGESDSDSDTAIDGKIDTPTAVIAPDAVGAKENGCLRPGPAIIKVQRGGDAFVDTPLDLELSYRVDGPADSRGLPPASAPLDYEQPTAAGTPTTLTAGTSFNDAPPVGDGVYRDSVVPGETRYLKVHLGWGQRVSVAFSAAEQRGYAIDDGFATSLTIANPLRAATERPTGATGSDSAVGFSEGSLFTSSEAPARYLNRDSDDSDIRAFAFAGDYYLVLTSGFAPSGRSAAIPYTMRVDVTGTPERGPKYDVGSPQSDPTPSTSGSSGTSGSGTPSSSSGTTSDRPGSPVAGEANDSGPSTPVVAGGITLALLLLVGLAGGLMVRRRAGIATHAGGDDTGAGGDTRTLPAGDW